MSHDSAIRHVSDTAIWSAYFRARESQRRDALFSDPYAIRLAGERGEQIAKAQPFHEKNAWAWVTRTVLFDEIINRELAAGADLVVNLAAGLDARPYRMQLPPSLLWVEVDLPEILDYKEKVLREAKPACRLERKQLDLSDRPARRAFFDSLAGRGTRALVISEGLLIYLAREQVKELACDLAGVPAFQSWLCDIASPRLLQMIQKGTRVEFGEGEPPMKFAPAEGPRFFRALGWEPVEVRSMLKTAARLKRLTLLMRFFALFPENPDNTANRPWSGGVLLRKTIRQ